MKRTRRNILLLDIGFANLGVAVVNCKTNQVLYADTLRPDTKKVKGAVIESTIQMIAEQVRQLKAVCKVTKPFLALAEYPHGGAKSASAMRAMNLAIGMLTAFLIMQDIPFVPIRPTETKHLIRPKGEVTKEEIQELCKASFGNVLPKQKCRAEHAADALALYLLYKGDKDRFRASAT